VLNMFNKIKILASAVAASAFILGVTLPAAAEGKNMPVEVQDAASFGEKLVEVFKAVGIPVGGAILFISVCIIAVNMMMYGINPEKKASAMSGLLWVAAGGALLGGAMFIAGAILGIGERLQ